MPLHEQTSSLTLAQLLKLTMEQRLQDLHVALPGKVEDYDASKQTATVKPLIKRHVAGDEGGKVVESLPVIYNVPVMFPRGGGYFLSFPLQAGDHVLIVFCERNISQWQPQGADVDPGDVELHPLSGAVCFPGLYPDSQQLGDANANNFVVGQDGGCQTHYTDQDIRLTGENPGDWVALANKVNANFDVIKNMFSAWIPVSQDGGAALKAKSSVDLAQIQDVASSKVKTD